MKSWLGAAAVAALLSSGCPKASGPEDAGELEPERTLAEEILNRADELSDRRWRAELYGYVAEAQIEASIAPQRSLMRAELLAKEIRDPTDRERVEGLLARVRAESGDPAGAIEAAEHIRSSDEKNRVLVELADLGIKHRRFDEVSRLVPRISDEDARCTAVVSLVRAEAAAGKIDAAKASLESCPKKARREEAMPAIVRGLAFGKAYAPAQKITDSILSVHFRSEALSAIAEARYREGKTKEAMKAAKAIESAWISARTYAALSLLAGKPGTSASDKLFQRSVAEAGDIKDQVMQASALEDIGMIAAGADRLDEVRALAARAPTREGRHKILSSLASRYAQKGKTAEAQAIAVELAQDPVWGGPAIGSVAAALAAAGDAGKALDLVASIPNLAVRLPIIARIGVIHTRDRRRLTSEILAKLALALPLAGKP